MKLDEPGSLGAATAPGADGPLGGLIAAIQARDGERIIAEMNRLADQLGTALPAIVHTTPDAGRLVDEMLDVLSGRAGALDTAGAWLQLGETAVTLGRDTLADEAAATALRRDPQSHGAPLLRAGWR